MKAEQQRGSLLASELATTHSLLKDSSSEISNLQTLLTLEDDQEADAGQRLKVKEEELEACKIQLQEMDDRLADLRSRLSFSSSSSSTDAISNMDDIIAKIQILNSERLEAVSELEKMKGELLRLQEELDLSYSETDRLQEVLKILISSPYSLKKICITAINLL